MVKDSILQSPFLMADNNNVNVDDNLDDDDNAESSAVSFLSCVDLIACPTNRSIARERARVAAAPRARSIGCGDCQWKRVDHHDVHGTNELRCTMPLSDIHVSEALLFLELMSIRRLVQ